MEDLFEDLESEGKIFLDKDVLYPTYFPDKLPHREEQIKILRDILYASLVEETPTNIMIYGNTGTGKSTAVKYVSKELEELARQKGHKCIVLYLNSEIIDTQYRVFAYLARVFNKRVPMTGWPTDVVYSELKKGIDTEERYVVVTLDDIEKLATDSGEILYSLSRINNELNNAWVTVIGISNDLTFAELLDQQVLSSLGKQELVFSSYTVDQLKDILNERAKKAFNESVLDEAVIPLCAALAAMEDGDASRALDLLRTSGEIAEHSKSNKVYEEQVMAANEQLETNWVIDVIKTLPLQSKIILNSMLILNREKNNRRFSSSEVYTVYQRLCILLGVEALTQRRVTDLISELDFFGLIKAVIVNRGRYGRRKEISLSVPTEFVQPVLLEDYRLRALAGTVLT
jgi:cell division control protein 6